MIWGLERGRVRLSRVTPSAAEFFRDVSEHLYQFIPSFWKLEHIGSTAVPRMLAKPILDVALAVASEAEFEHAITLVQDAGYRYRGFRAEAGGHIFDFLESAFTTQHIHLVCRTSPQWERYLDFRELLRESYAARSSYERVKKLLAKQYPFERRIYTAKKIQIIDELLSANQ